MDDILCLWNGPAHTSNLLLTTKNNMFPNIKFIVEYGGKAINFLDVNKSIANNLHEFAILRKDTSTDIIIDGTSFCHPSHKDVSLHRLVTLPLMR